MNANDLGKSADGDALTLQDKIEYYFKTHKKPMTVQMMADRFWVHPRTIRKTLTKISGLVVVIIGQTHWYRRKV